MSAQPIPVEHNVRQPITADPQRAVEVAQLLPGINRRYEYTLRRLGR